MFEQVARNEQRERRESLVYLVCVAALAIAVFALVLLR
jgi:hypothetical protein